MAKRAIKKKVPDQAAGPSIADIEKQIGQLDRELVKQANERAKLFQKLAKLRKAADEPTYDLNEEQRLVQETAGTGKGPLSETCLRSILREVTSGSRALVAPLRVAFLGPAYSYSHLAAAEFFGTGAELVPVSNIAAVFEEVNRHQVDFGIVPIENSTDGRIVDTLDMFSRLPVQICGEAQLRIHHHLLARCERSEIQEVYSKPQALSQCREWLARHLAGVRTVEMTSTAAAAQLAADKPGAAAVASHQAAVRYGLNVVASNIEDNRNNITRFAVIGNESPRRSGNDKTSIMFEIPHQPGALADAMAIFKRNRLNLTWIESFPMSGSKNEYLFFVEFEGHQTDMKARRALASLEKKTVRLDVLGSYARKEPVE
jgi:chorismate mutase/prephenate dehydratase